MWKGCQRNFNEFHYGQMKIEEKKLNNVITEEVRYTVCTLCGEKKDEEKRIIIQL